MKNKLWVKLFPDKEKKAEKKAKKLKEGIHAALKEIKKESEIHMSKEEAGVNTKFLYDFINERYDHNRWGQLTTESRQDQMVNPMIPETRIIDGVMERGVTVGGEWIPRDFAGTQITMSTEDKKLEIKIEVKPIDVVGELERVPTSWSQVGIDEKITILQEKTELIKNNYAKREVNGMLERLQNRKKYFIQSATGETFKEFFTKFDSTTEEKVEELVKKYPHLTLKDSDLFIPEFPDVAIEMMRQYTEKCKELCDKKPVFQVIAPAAMFKEKYKRRDPILLAQSPFGFYYDILGAWDEEMVMLSEL